MSNGFDTSVFVDTNELQSWQNNINSINSACVDVLNNCKSLIDTIDNSWQGNSADSFKSQFESYLTDAIAVHEDLKNISDFLQVVVYTMESE